MDVVNILRTRSIVISCYVKLFREMCQITIEILFQMLLTELTPSLAVRLGQACPEAASAAVTGARWPVEEDAAAGVVVGEEEEAVTEEAVRSSVKTLTRQLPSGTTRTTFR